MSKRIITHNNFSKGVLSPRLHSRSETKEYPAGMDTCNNATSLPHGPVRRRNGFQFKAETKDSSVDARFIEYQLSKDVAFIIEMGNLYMRFYNSSGQVLESDVTISGATAANPVVVTATSHGYSNGDYVYITGVVGMTELNSSTVPYKVANKNDDDFEITDVDDTNIDGSAFTAYSSGGVANKIFEIVSPYTTAQLDGVQYSQSDTTMFLVHADVSPRTLVRTTDTDWTTEELVFLPPPTFQSGFEPDATLTPSATTGTSINFTAGSAVFLPGDVGRQINNNSTGEVGRASIIAFTSTTVVICDIIEDFTNTDAIASGDWKMDLSPIVDLEFDASAAGAIVNIRSEYSAGSLGTRLSITAVTKADPGVVTTASSHGLANGESVQIQDIIGMTQINDKIFTVDNVTATTFELKGENTTAYTTYGSGGIVRQKLDDLALGAFRSDDVGSYILANGGVLQIITVAASDDVDAEIIKSMNDKATTGNWSLETPTWTAARGYPNAVGIHQQRLWLGKAQNLKGSEIGILEGFGAGPDDEDSVDVDIESNEANQISWIRAGRDLVVGTTGEELTLESGSSSAINPTNVRSTPRTRQGSTNQQVSKIGDEIIFVDSPGNDLISFRYDFNIDGYRDTNLMFLAEHLPKAGSGIKETSYAKSPDTLLYSVLNNGTMLVSVYDRSLKVIGTTVYTTYGDFKRVKVLSTPTVDQVWVIVERVINGSTKKFVELYVDGDGTNDVDGFSDSYLTLSNPLVITDVTVANPAVVTSASHGLSDGDTVTIKDLVNPELNDLDSTKTNMTGLNNGIYTVANKTASTFELTATDTSGFNAYGSGGNAFERVTSITGLDHLEGQTVQVKGDGAAQTDQTVTSGAITITAAGEVVVGLKYLTTIKTLDKEYDVGMGSMLGQRTAWVRPLIRVNGSVPPTVNGAFLPARNTDDELGNKVPLFTGYFEYGALDSDDTTQLTITLDSPFPLEITGVTGTVNGNVV